jgi:phage shock protein PspC (stress-responsive transcriptional regulator)
MDKRLGSGQGGHMSDQHNTEGNDERARRPEAEGPARAGTAPGASSPGQGRRLTRSRSDRMIAGVAGGLAEYLDVDPTLVRVGFAASILFGGIGILIYLVLALVAPEGDGAPGIGARRSGPPIWLIVLAVIAFLIFLPGPFWLHGGWHGWWWGWGAGWLLLISIVAVSVYLLARGRGGGRLGGGGGSSTASAEGEPATGGGPDRPDAGAEATTVVADEPPPNRGPHPVVRALAIALLVAIAICAALSVAVVSAWSVATGHGAIAAGTVIALGVILAATAISGRAAHWLLVPALVIGIPAGAIAASNIRFDNDIGQRQYDPGTVAEIPADGYSLGVGQMIVDLRAIPWHRGQVVPVKVDQGVGQVVISVPPRACVEADATASAGEVLVRGQRSDGINPDVSTTPPMGDAPRIVVDAHLDIGQLLVTDRPPEDFTGGDSGFRNRFHDGGSDVTDAQERLDAQRACAA